MVEVYRENVGQAVSLRRVGSVGNPPSCAVANRAQDSILPPHMVAASSAPRRFTTRTRSTERILTEQDGRWQGESIFSGRGNREIDGERDRGKFRSNRGHGSDLALAIANVILDDERQPGLLYLAATSGIELH